jgi:hypothetical protein
VPNISLKADIGRIDAGQTLKQLELPEIVVGTVDAMNLEGSSRGKTLHALLEQAAITLQIRPAKVNYTTNFAAQKVNDSRCSFQCHCQRCESHKHTDN